MMSVPVSPRTPKDATRGGRCGHRTPTLTVKGHYEVLRAMGYTPDQIVWVPIVDVPWYQDKRRGGEA